MMREIRSAVAAAAVLMCLAATSAKLPAADNDGMDGRYYSADQAVRGRLLFNKQCGYCHAADPDQPPQPGAGAWVGESRGRMSLRGLAQRTFGGKQTYPTVFYLYSKVESMPPHGVDSITAHQRADIVAFLLSSNGLPAGTQELSPDTTRMKAMMLLEAGFQSLFNGADFTGWKFLLGPNCRPAPLGCGKTEPGSIFHIDNGVIFCSGKIHGLMYTAQKYLNFTLRLDYRFERPPDWEGDEELFRGNSGYMLFIKDLQIWPRTVTMQGENRNILEVTPVNTTVKGARYDLDAKRRAIRPLGEWNSIEIVSKAGELKGLLNGTLIASATEHEFKEPGFIGFQSEGAPIQWRNIRIRPE